MRVVVVHTVMNTCMCETVADEVRSYALFSLPSLSLSLCVCLVFKRLS